jgi:hypothetical protein
MVANYELGPTIYENWLASTSGGDPASVIEVPMFTDCRILGNDPEGLGPYAFINTVNTFPSSFLFRSSLVVRISQYDATLYTSPQIEETDTSRYHGGGLPDELTAFVALILGIRITVGGMTRRIVPGRDPLGTPVSWDERADPLPVFLARPRILPNLPSVCSLEGLELLAKLQLLTPAASVALVRAARLYRDAVWYAEVEPNLSWLLLVSAVETVANYRSSQLRSPLTILRNALPSLSGILDEHGDPQLTRAVAAQLAPLLGPTTKFVNFLVENLPPQPTARPSKWQCANWSKRAMRRSLSVIYEHRSRALHDGTPFPFPLCSPPFNQPQGGIAAERPIGLGERTRLGTWMAADLPFHLHIFEYIVRRALLNWWETEAEVTVAAPA